MPINSRQKGAAGERELSRELEALTGIRLTRNLEQTRNGGHDLLTPADATGPAAETLARLALEVKRYAQAKPALIARWWQQAEDQADRAGLWPCLAYRADRQPWRIRLPMAAILPDWPAWPGPEWTMELDLMAFAALIREGSILPPATMRDAGDPEKDATFCG
jgi:hypothetical protein